MQRSVYHVSFLTTFAPLWSLRQPFWLKKWLDKLTVIVTRWYLLRKCIIDLNENHFCSKICYKFVFKCNLVAIYVHKSLLPSLAKFGFWPKKLLAKRCARNHTYYKMYHWHTVLTRTMLTTLAYSWHPGMQSSVYFSSGLRLVSAIHWTSLPNVHAFILCNLFRLLEDSSSYNIVLLKLE